MALLLLGVAIAARFAQFGNPVIQVDEEFYLLTGDRMLHGALPYIDIWDRKPVGLFLLYAGIRLLGGEGVLQYQIVAGLFATATAFTIAILARRVTGPLGAAAAAIIYILYLGIFGGDGGQSPVFYNLPMAVAALLTLRVLESERLGLGAFASGTVAMLLVGLALQIKYSAVFEGAFLGLTLLWCVQRRYGLPSACAAALVWSAAALLPTAGAWAYYAAIGHGSAFIQANFLSILSRGSDGWFRAIRRLIGMALLLAPLGLSAWLAPVPDLSDVRGRRARMFVLQWLSAAIAGVLLFGSYFDHYALPLLVPLCVAAAPLFEDRRAGLLITGPGRQWRVPAGVTVMLIATAFSISTISKNRRDRGSGPEVDRIANFIKPLLTGSLYVFHGEPSLYRLTGSRLPTRWIFPNHLNLTRENGTLGVNSLSEVERILSTKPQFIVTSTRPERDINPAIWRYMEVQLASHYQQVLTQEVGIRSRIVYERRSAQ